MEKAIKYIYNGLLSAMFDLGWVLETSPGEALGGSWEHPAVHWGEVMDGPISMSVSLSRTQRQPDETL